MLSLSVIQVPGNDMTHLFISGCCDLPLPLKSFRTQRNSQQAILREEL